MGTRPQEDSVDRGVYQPERLLTETDLAQRWQVSVKTLQNARVSGAGVRFLKIGRTVRYRLADITQYEEASTRASTSDRGGS